MTAGVEVAQEGNKKMTTLNTIKSAEFNSDLDGFIVEFKHGSIAHLQYETVTDKLHANYGDELLRRYDEYDIGDLTDSEKSELEKFRVKFLIKGFQKIKIKLSISTQDMGENTQLENERYISAVRTAIESEYPNADVDVNLVSGFESCHVSDDLTGDIKNSVLEIMNDIWASANY